MTDPIVQTHQLTKRYGNFTALDHCNLEVDRGEVFGLLGPNGAGKTTLIRTMLGYIQPTAGEAFLDGLHCHRQTLEVHRRVAYLPGEVRLFRRMRGRDVLQFLTQLRADGNVERAYRIADRLDTDLSRRVAQCSSGMRQKLGLAAVFALDTPLLILDEPTTHLDPTARNEVVQLVREAHDRGQTVLFSSHVLSEVEAVSHRTVVLRRGKLVHIQKMDELRKQHRISAQFSGELPPLPDSLDGVSGWQTRTEGAFVLDVRGDLTPLLGWLATLPIKQISIQPLGLASVYERYHASSLEDDPSPQNGIQPGEASATSSSTEPSEEVTASS
ncbi:Phosphonate-transporting ATPase [Planctomycetales bacterium 10988]|nr:Phosphonate-transporting ATPase [Planctomycetales bacterium 10988]